MSEQTVTEQEVKCYHCGGDCEDGIIEAYDKVFCCEGCKTVYEILNENDLCTYYDFENNPGIKIKKSLGSKYAYLDNKEIEQNLLEFDDAGMGKIRFFVPKIHCSSCIWLLENLYRLNEGVIQSQVNFLKKEVYITYRKESISLREVVELMASIGYEPSISLKDFNKKKVKSGNKAFYYKLGVAGFCFGNIMLLSFPEYLSSDASYDTQYKILFGYLNLVLSLPVLLYSASEYFVSAWKAIRNKFVNIDLPISIGIIALFSRSAYEIITITGAGFMDSFTMLVFLLLVGKWYQNKTYQALSFDRDYQSYFPVAVTRITDEGEVAVPVQILEVGDEIVLRNQEIIPADSELLTPETEIDYSFVTGESVPVKKLGGETIFAGGRQIGASIHLKIIRPVSQSYLTRLWNQEAFSKEETPMNSILNKVSKYFTLFIMSVAVITLLFWLPSDTSMAIKTFTAVLIIACPCALALTVPFTFGNTIRIFGKHQFYLKNTEVIEKMAGIDTVVFDKTGTLTHSSGVKIEFKGTRSLTEEERVHIRSIVQHSTHPLSKAIYNSMTEKTIECLNFKETAGQGIYGEIDEVHYQLGSAAFVGEKTEVLKDQTSSTVYAAKDGVIIGYFIIRKEYRTKLKEVLNSLKNQYKIHLVSGDNDVEKQRLSAYFDQDQMLFNQKPEDKLQYIEKLQADEHKVLMIGDGLNDAGALKQADIGIAISDDVYNFSPACDAILDADQFSQLNQLVQFSKTAMKIVRFSFLISLTYNIIGLSFAVRGMVTPLFAAVLMPISSVSVVAFVTIASNIAAKRLKSL
tara:strand:+ start:9477 stop:11882 length:2406 start_codon:yes stop_codon:yes gene_type:complete